ncbi:MAG TPA: carbohydrate-binding family 9-like protein [Bryobacteraceae bacterium]|nr:carbohydrate-binding family 9-like protein [Bryobacteraceae bacterium]
MAQKDWEPNADPQSPEWDGVPGVEATKDLFGMPISLPPTEIRSRWTRKNLYLLFICPYDELNLKPNPVTSEETNNLWNWDVAEAFIGADYLNTSRYKEFQVSPQGEYVDLDIDRDDPKTQKGVEWQSGFSAYGRVDSKKKVWYGEMKIPFAAFEKTPKAGDELRIGLYRILGAAPNRIYLAWRPTGASTFHVPSAFGSLVLK